MTRKLAHIELINEVKEIPGADRIEMVKVLGWECVTKKGEFQVGDKVVYIEIDSIMPDKPEYEFLRNKKFRIKTIKLRKQISQGLVLPLPQEWTVRRDDRCRIGSDVTDDLEITKYITPFEKAEVEKQAKTYHWTKNFRITKWLWRYKWFREFLFPVRKKEWPKWVSKTDEERIQNIPQVLEDFKDNLVYVTEKIDYQSATFTSNKKGKFFVASRNLINSNKDSLYWRIAKKYNLEKICKKFPGIVIQGEQGNVGVQGNKYLLEEPKLWIFNVIMPNGKHLGENGIKVFCKNHDLTTVPFIRNCILSELGSTVEELVKYSEEKSLVNTKIQREGIVIRCIEDDKKILSFKVINPKFLLKHE